MEQIYTNTLFIFWIVFTVSILVTAMIVLITAQNKLNKLKNIGD